MSYFNHPVKVAVFQAAMFGLIERLLRKAGRSEDVRIQLLFVGDTACVVWSWIGGVVRGTLRLPALKVGSMIDREKANRWVGYIIHEVFHVLFTHNDTWQAFASAFPGLRKSLANALEDARIERSGMALGYADGFKVVGKDLLAHLLVTGGMDVNPNDPRQIPWVFAVGCRGYGVQGEARLLSALDPRIKVILAEAKARVDAIPATITPKGGTTATCQIALWVYAELQKLNTAPPPPPPEDDDEEEEGEGPGGDPGGDEPGGDEGDGPVGPGRKRPPKDGTGRNDREPTGDEDDDDREEGEAEDSYDDEPDEPGDEGDEGEEGGGEPGGNNGGGEREDEDALCVGDKVICPDGTTGRIVAINGDDAEVAPL